MDIKKEPPPMCKIEDGAGDHPYMITQEEKYQTVPDLSSGGSSGNQLKDLRVSHALAARDMAETVQDLYPRFDRYLLSKCEASDQYGVELRRDALKRLYMTYAPTEWKKIQRRHTDRHRLTRSIRCRLDEPTYQALLSVIHENGFETVQDWLESTVRVILGLRRKEAADETDPR